MTKADVIVVLGCTIRAGAPSAALTRRLDLAARAFRHELAPRVIVSGGRSWDGHVEALVMQRALRQRGVGEDAIRLELLSLNTRENGHYSAQLMRELGARSAFLATCGWHLPRARASFERCGVVVVDPPREWIETPPARATTRLRESLWRLFT